MPGQDATGRYVPDNEPYPLADLASAARTATGTGTAFSTAGVDSLNVLLTVTAVGANTPTLVLTVETTADGTNYYTAGTFTQVSTVTTQARVVGDLGLLSRYVWTIGGGSGSPSLTFSVSATANKD